MLQIPPVQVQVMVRLAWLASAAEMPLLEAALPSPCLHLEHLLHRLDLSFPVFASLDQEQERDQQGVGLLVVYRDVFH